MRWIKGYCAVHKAWHKVTKIILSRTISYLNVAKLQLKMTTSTMMLCVLYSKLLRLFPLNFVQDMNHQPYFCEKSAQSRSEIRIQKYCSNVELSQKLDRISKTKPRYLVKCVPVIKQSGYLSRFFTPSLCQPCKI